MTRTGRGIAVLLGAPLLLAALSGCVAAAAVPVVAGGLVAKKASDGRGGKPARQRRSRAAAQATPVPAALPADPGAMQPGVAYAGALPSPATATGTPAAKQAGGDAGGRDKPRRSRGKGESVPVPAAAPAALPLPADPREMRPGVTYTGSLPSPYAPAAGMAPATTGPARSSWTEVGRYVAGLPATQTDSALLVRGSTSETPAFAPCGARPRTVLARLETAATQGGAGWRFAREAQQWLEALQVLEVPVIFTSPAPAAARSGIEAAFRTAGLAKLLDLGELRLELTPAAMPAERASVAVKACVIAVVGREASDFPNALLPEATPPALAGKWGAGWFRIPGD